MKLFNWIPGRQGTGYERLQLFRSKWLRCDCLLLRMKPNTYIPKHLDPIDKQSISLGYKAHHRLNIILTNTVGGDFQCVDMTPEQCSKRIIKFRPDIQVHKVSEVLSGTRYVLSIGWLSKNADKN